MKKPLLPAVLSLLLLVGASAPLHARQTGHPSVRDTVAGVIGRLKRELGTNELQNLTSAQAEEFLTPQEREILATEHLTFRVNAPVRITVLRDTRLGSQPFWLRARGFQPANLTLTQGKLVYDAWQKDFAAGPVGLGVHALSGGNNHYLVTLAPKQSGGKIEVSDLHPEQLRLTTLKVGAEPYIDQPDVLTSVPPELEGQILIRTDTDREEDAQLANLFRMTQYPASERPDQLVLTWSRDPRTSQTVQWRTSSKGGHGYVQFQKKSGDDHLSFGKAARAAAETTRLETPTLLNDPVVHRHTAVLRGLAPGTAYVYRVGDGSETGWTEPAEFTTAPEGAQPFSFIYMGDAQNGLDRWGTLVHNAFRLRPDAAFYLMAGDLVNRGAERNDWDSFFHNARGIYDRRTLVPVIGNHECQGGKPELYLKQFALPKNGPSAAEPERAYLFQYGNALFVILDSNLVPSTQSAWLDEKLSQTSATWKFVTFHHPAYSSGGNRDNVEVRAAWTPLFDKHHVDMVFQGHDHAYLRTYPLKAGQRVATPREGTVYIISVSGTKAYPQFPRDYTEVGLTNVPTFQALDIQAGANRLVYRAYDTDGKPRDELVIEK